MKFSLLIVMPDTDTMDSFDPDVTYEIQAMKALYPKGDKSPGSLNTFGRHLISCIITVDSVDLETVLGSMLISYNLDWEFGGCQSFKDHPTEDVGGDVTWAPVVVIPFNNDVVFPYLSEGEGVKNKSWVSYYQGQVKW